MSQIIAFKFKIELEINFEMPNPFDELLDINAVNLLDLKRGKQLDNKLRDVSRWLKGVPCTDLKYASFEIWKMSQNGVVY